MRTVSPLDGDPRHCEAPSMKGAMLVASLAGMALASGPVGAAPVDEARDAAPRACSTTIEARSFAGPRELRRLTAKIAGFGLRNPGSPEHDRMLTWLERELRAVPGMRVRSPSYRLNRWQPLPEAPGRTPGRDLARAGGLKVRRDASMETVAVAGAVPFTEPTPRQGKEGELVYLPGEGEITAADAQGKIVVRDVPPGLIPYAAFGAIGHYLTPDFPATGNYDRAFLRELDPTLVDAGTAGALGVVFVWDVPTEQVRGYWGPHTGTRYRVSGVHVGNDRGAELKQAAAAGHRARIVVRAKWDRATTRNVIATLPGRSRERIVFNTNTDGNTWVQENGSAGMLALARYLAALPAKCRQRDVEFALTSAHMGFAWDGTFAYGDRLDEGYDKGTVAFVIAMEHLGTREQAPTGPGRRLEFTGRGEPLAWSAPAESPVLVDASIAAVKRRELTRTAVLQGVGAPDTTQVPQICSQGGLGTNFHSLLIPTIGAISGPWAMFDPVFGENAINFRRMRGQALALGDVARTLDHVPRTEIAGSYIAAREQRANGAKACVPFRPPAVASPSRAEPPPPSPIRP
jgi:hypothetical protein